LLVNMSVSISTGIRAYVAGEGMWAKAQKESVIHLTNYIYTEDEYEFESFQSVLRINLGDKKARLEMVKDDPDIDVIFEGFLAGYNHPEDIPHMITVYQKFGWLSEVQKATDAWKSGDDKIEELISFADQIHQKINDGDVSIEQRISWAADLEVLDHELTEQEMIFAGSMGELARKVRGYLQWSTISLGLILIALGCWLTLRFLNSTKIWMRTLEESEDKFRTLFSNSRDVLYKMNLTTQQYEYVSPGIKNMLGYETEEFLAGGPKWIYSNIHPKDKESMARVMERYEHVKNDHFLPVVEFRLKDKFGKYKWVSNVRSLLKDKDGNPEAIVGSVRDISDKKMQDNQLRASLKEKEILLQEIHHRVKNNLTIVSSLLELQKDGVNEETKALLSASQSRIISIAKVHEKLYESTNLSEIQMDVYISELAEEIEKAYRSDKKNIEMELDIMPYVMEINQAIPCGLILNELINNGYKHGFSGRKEGIMRISLSKKGKGVELVVENNGNKLEEGFDPFESKSLGMTLVKVLIKRFEGEITVESGEWIRFCIYFEEPKARA
ncbi:MAG: histidine kinase dimerization/phosphoacceptor domain -containing protein, partial [Balneolaceae bacterium]